MDHQIRRKRKLRPPWPSCTHFAGMTTRSPRPWRLKAALDQVLDLSGDLLGVPLQGPHHDAAELVARELRNLLRRLSQEVLDQSLSVCRVAPLQCFLDNMRCVAVPRILHQVLTQDANNLRLLMRQAVLKSTLNHMVAVGVSNELTNLRKHFIDQLHGGGIPGSVLQHAAVDPATILMASIVKASLRHLLDDERDLIESEHLDDLLQHVVRMRRLDGINNAAPQTVGNLDCSLLVHNIESRLHGTAAGWGEGQAPHRVGTPEQGHGACHRFFRMLTFGGQEPL
mmetsp:Transcript_66169/g.215297  ORF Transcript_66169/g.215297 Transcript_66169/m.215297 type:complete len:283 (+) Transcript_66169:428-1276(+)